MTQTPESTDPASEPTDDGEECEYALCKYGPEEVLEGPDGIYAFCKRHARRMVEYSPNFDWRGEIA